MGSFIAFLIGVFIGVFIGFIVSVVLYDDTNNGEYEE